MCQHFTSVHPENAVMYSVGSERQIFEEFSLKRLHCRATVFSALYGYRAVGHFLTSYFIINFLQWSIGNDSKYSKNRAHIDNAIP